MMNVQHVMIYLELETRKFICLRSLVKDECMMNHYTKIRSFLFELNRKMFELTTLAHFYRINYEEYFDFQGIIKFFYFTLRHGIENTEYSERRQINFLFKQPSFCIHLLERRARRRLYERMYRFGRSKIISDEILKRFTIRLDYEDRESDLAEESDIDWISTTGPSECGASIESSSICK